MSEYRRLRVRWFNMQGCELARVDCFNERDAATQLGHMIADAGGEISDGDRFMVQDLGATGE